MLPFTFYYLSIYYIYIILSILNVSIIFFTHLLSRPCIVVTACSWSTQTACWTRTVCANASQSCRPTWSSSRGSWRGSGTGAGSRCSRAALAWTVWVDRTAVQDIHLLFPPRPHVSCLPLSPLPPLVPPVPVQRGPVLRPLLFPRPGPETSGQ